MSHVQRIHPPRARFDLKDKKQKETLIYLTIRVNGKRVKWSTRDRVAARDWNPATGRAVVRARSVGLRDLNNRLDKYAKEAIDLFYEEELDTAHGRARFRQDEFKKELDYRLGFAIRPSAEGQLDTSDFMRFAESVSARVKEDISMSPATIKGFANRIRRVRDFVDAHHGGELGWNEVDDLFFDGLKRFLFRVRGYNRQSVNNVMKTLRTVIIRAEERGLMDFTKKIKKNCKQSFRRTLKAALNRVELDATIAHDLSDSPRLDKVRDLFVIGVLTAQRWSDYSRLTPDNFTQLPGGKGYRYTIGSQQKGGRVAGGPVMDWGLPVLRKYGYIGGGAFDPPSISAQKFNEYLKEVMQLIIPDATFIVYQDGERLDSTGTKVPKWTLISSHTARRTAVSLLRSLKVPDHQIQKMTGHKSIAEMDGYDVRQAETLALDLFDGLNESWRKQGLRAV